MQAHVVRRWLSVPGLVVGVVTACSSGDDATGDSTDPAVDTACAAYAEQTCRRSQACLPEDFSSGWGDHATCSYGWVQNCKRRLRANGTRETATTVSSCAMALAQLSCGDAVPSSCEVPAGERPQDSPCAYSSQCQGRCYSSAMPTDCGACTSPSSTSGNLCAGTWCPVPQFCIDGVCAVPPRLAEGEPCGGIDMPRCPFPLVCIGKTPTANGKCSRPAQEGAPCEWEQFGPFHTCSIPDGLTCDRATLTCKRFTPLFGPGESCASGRCDGRAYCNINLICEPKGRLGEKCGSYSDACLPPGRCEPVTLEDGGFRLECRAADPQQCR